METKDRRLFTTYVRQRLFYILVLGFGLGSSAFGDDGDSGQNLERLIVGEWRLELRILRYRDIVDRQENGALFVSQKLPDGTFRVITHFTVFKVMGSPGRSSRPECEGKTECTYDNGSEGVGRLIGDKFYVDWIDEGWIDDVFTITGNKMNGDDGRGPINLTKVE